MQAQATTPATTHYRRDDNFVATLGFADGSVATLTYTALGLTGESGEVAEHTSRTSTPCCLASCGALT